MSRYALIDKTTKVVVNLCEWDGDNSKWQPPANIDAIQVAGGNIGDTYDSNTGTFTSPPATQPAPNPDTELANAIANATTLDQLKAALLGQNNPAAVKGRASQ